MNVFICFRWEFHWSLVRNCRQRKPRKAKSTKDWCSLQKDKTTKSFSRCKLVNPSFFIQVLIFICFLLRENIGCLFVFSESILLFGCFFLVLFQEATRFEPEEWEPGEFGTPHQASQLEPLPFHQVVIGFKLN